MRRLLKNDLIRNSWEEYYSLFHVCKLNRVKIRLLCCTLWVIFYYFYTLRVYSLRSVQMKWSMNNTQWIILILKWVKLSVMVHLITISSWQTFFKNYFKNSKISSKVQFGTELLLFPVNNVDSSRYYLYFTNTFQNIWIHRVTVVILQRALHHKSEQ